MCSSTCPTCPPACAELHRLVNKQTGRLLIVIPTEGSPAYGLARRLSAQRVWYRHFTAPYVEFYGREHINLVPEILEELHPWFTIERRSHASPCPSCPLSSAISVLAYDLKPRALQPLPG